jgi:alpha-NAC-related protein
MFGKINPKQLEGMMKKMGISNAQIDAKRVIIECDGENIIIDEPNVMKVSMQGQESWQITGEARSESREGFSDEDVEMVMQKTGKKEAEVREFLKENGGDIALAIMELSR